LKILLTFILCVALEKKSVAFIALAYALACIYICHVQVNFMLKKPNNMVKSTHFI
jgi:hypothetical protein